MKARLVDVINSHVSKTIFDWQVLAYAGMDANQKYHLAWVRCKCGKVLRRNWENIARAKSQRCIDCKKLRTSHGHTLSRKQSSEYKSWMHMKARSSRNRRSSSTYSRYRGSGIYVCERWELFENFLSDMGLKPTPAHTIDRIDNTKGYSPENCRWATTNEQNRNRRTTLLIEHDGTTLCASDWAVRLGMSNSTFWRRIKSGRTVSEIIMEIENG